MHCRLVNSNFLEPGFLVVVRKSGFLLGLLLGYNLFARGPRRFTWLLVVFIGALCTKGLILVCEHLRFYSWPLLQASPYFFTLICMRIPLYEEPLYPSATG